MHRDWRKMFAAVALTAAFAAVLAVRWHPTWRARAADAMAPFTEAPAVVTGEPDGDLFRASKVELISRIRELEAEREADHLRETQVPEVEAENAELRGLLGLAPPLGFRLVIARIVTRDPASGGRRLRLDHGSADGLEPGQAVLADGVLLGRVLEVAEHSAVVITLVDPQCKVSVWLPERDVHGILVGAGQASFLADPFCRMEYLPRDLDYYPGEVVRTSSFGRQVPPGLPVGELAGIDGRPVAETIDALYRNVTVTPYVCKRHFGHVAVVVRTTDPAVSHRD